MSAVPLSKLLRQARKAVSKQAYHEAEELYASIIQFLEMVNDLDIRLRYAYCTEKKTENLKQAIEGLRNRPDEEEGLQQEEPEEEKM